MNYEQFRNQARLYVVGALYPHELAEFEQAIGRFGRRAEDFISECRALRDAFALSLRPAGTATALAERVRAMKPVQAAG